MDPFHLISYGGIHMHISKEITYMHMINVQYLIKGLNQTNHKTYSKQLSTKNFNYKGKV